MKFHDRLAKMKDLSADEPASLKQRTALFNMLSALGDSTAGLKNLTKKEASKMFDEISARIKRDGFPEREDSHADHYDPYNWSQE